MYTFIFIVICGTVNTRLESYPDEPDLIRGGLFLAYLSFFLAVWTVYFLSRNFLKVCSLRRVLGATSISWPDALFTTATGDALREADARNDAMRDKGRTSMQVLGLFVATTVLELVQVRYIIIQLQERAAETELVFQIWDAFIVAGAGICAFTAFVCFIVSGDALDAMFNSFQKNDANDKVTERWLIRHFYRETITPKYIGLVAMILSAILIIGFHSKLFAASLIAITIGIGYPHWFPDFRHFPKNRRPFNWARFLLFSVGACTPLVTELWLLIASHS
jgi:hypothetical protein